MAASASLPQLSWLSSLADVPIATDEKSVDVSVLCAGVAVLRTTLFAIGGKATLFDLASLVADEMRRKGLATAKVSVSVSGSVIASSQVVFADAVVTADVSEFIRNNFLSTLKSKRVAAAGEETVTAIVAAGESTQFSALVVYELNGEVATAEISLGAGGTASAYAAVSMSVSLDTVGRYVEDAQIPFSRILAFSVKLGSRTLPCYVANSSPSARLFFRNMFNCWEMFSLPATTARNTDVERSTAFLGNESMFYDQSVYRSYKVVTAPLDADEPLWCEQLAASLDVRFDDGKSSFPEKMPKVLVTDSSAEFADDSSEDAVFEFTWRFADRCPRVSPSEVISLTGVFTEQFTYQFS